MILVDVNIVLPAHRSEHPDHQVARSWLIGALENGTSLGLADVTISGFTRIATDRRVFEDPATLEEAIHFVDRTIEAGAEVITAGPRHWSIMRGVLSEARASGNLVSDAHLAAIAIEHGARIATRDRDFARFPAVEWFDPLG